MSLALSQVIMENSTAAFLSAFFAGKPADQFILIWTKKQLSINENEKTSIWFRRTDDAASAAASILDRDVYFGVGTSPRDFGPKKRCLAGDISTIFGVWIDIDIADGIHKKANLPASIAEATALLSECDLTPTFVVHSGGGLQAYWLFQKPIFITDDGVREVAKSIAMRWNIYFKNLAAPHKWDIDSVMDLARVMRLPGTNNMKTGEPRPVQILENNGVRYESEEIDAYLDRQLIDNGGIVAPPKPRAAADQRPVAIIAGAYKLDPNAVFDPDKFDLLGELDPKFTQTWRHKRKDFQDQSLSTYDMSLAAITLRAGWTDQEIIDLLVHHRRKYGDDKIDGRGQLRRDYYDRTLSRAKAFRGVSDDETPLNADPTPEETPAPSADQRVDRMKKLSEILGAHIKNIARVMEDPPYFRLDLATGVSIDLGDAGGILNMNSFRNKVATASKLVIPRFSAAKWDNIASRLLEISQDEKPDPIETPAGFVRYYLREYLASKTTVKHSDPEALENSPFVWHDNLYITQAKFQEFLLIRKIGIKKLSAALRSAGCVQDVRHVGPADGKHTTKSCWRVPADIFEAVIILDDK
jgi:hypothetical protein